MDEPREGRDKLAGWVYVQAQVASWLAVVGVLACFSKSGGADYFSASMFMIAATLGFGLLANAVLRK